jgi:hypothetical protein
MIPVFSDYQNREWNWPSKNINPNKKGAEYCRSVSESIYSLFLRNKTSWAFNAFKDFYVNRDYSRGEQDNTQYKNFLLQENTEDGDVSSVSNFDDTPVGRVTRRAGWKNLMWQNVSPAPMLMNAIHSTFDKMGFDVMVDTIDSNSKALKEEQKYVKLCEAQNADWQIEYKKNAGIPVDEDIVFPKSVEELAMYEARDGFKLNIARAMQKLVRHSFNISDWDGTIRKKSIDDLAVLGYGAVRDYFDTEDSKWKVKYLDPAKLVIQYSNEYDYKDSEYAGYFCYWTISNLRNKLPDVPENEWTALAKACYTLYGNPRDRWMNFYSQLDPTTGTYRYDGFKVPVFECEWMDTDTEKKLYYTSVRGRESIIDLDYDSIVKELDKDRIKAGASQVVKKIFKRVVRQSFWVLNTDYVFDFGVVNMASREGLSKPQLTFHVEQLLEPALMKRMIPILDQICMMFLRWQNSLAMMIERGYAINTSMLANVTFGGQKLKPAEVLKLWQQTGRLLYSYANTPTGLYSGGAALPVVPMEGGLGTRVDETMKALQMLFWELEKITGINPVTLGQTPDKNVPVATTEAAMQATSNVLKPILDALFEIKGSAATSMMRRLQIGLRNSAKIKEAYTGVIAPNDMDAIVSMEGEGVQYGCTLKPKPDAKQKAIFENWINIALQNTREQRPGIDLNDAVYFMSQLENGADILELENELRYKIEKNKQAAEKQSQDMIKLQAQTNAQNEQTKTQGAIALSDAQSKGKMQEEAIRGNIKDSLLTKQFNMEFLKQLQDAANAEKGLNIKSPNGK